MPSIKTKRERNEQHKGLLAHLEYLRAEQAALESEIEACLAALEIGGESNESP